MHTKASDRHSIKEHLREKRMRAREREREREREGVMGGEKLNRRETAQKPRRYAAVGAGASILNVLFPSQP